MNASFAPVVAWALPPDTCRRVTTFEIKQRVCAAFDVPIIEMTSARQSRHHARVRQVAMYLSRHLTKQSLPQIGARFGGRDHSTVMYAIRIVGERRAADPLLDAQISRIERELGA